MISRGRDTTSGGRRAQPTIAGGIAPGDYLCSPTKLLYVECLDVDRAVLEDCATGELITVPADTLFALRLVRRSAIGLPGRPR